MKRIGKLISSIFVLELLFACTPITSEKEMYVSYSAAKTEFNVGEVFNHDGLEVIDVNSFNPILNYKLSIEDGYQFTADDIGEQLVTVSKYGYKSESYTINVTNYPKLIIVSYPKVQYEVGERLSFAGLEVSNGTITITNYEPSIAEGTVLNNTGEFEIFLTKTGYFPVSFTITVKLAKALSIRTLPSITSFEQGQEFSSSGLVVVDENDEIVTDYSLSISDGDILKNKGTIEVMVTKVNYQSTSFTIEVTEGSGGVTEDKTLKIYYVNDTHGSYIRQELAGTTNEGGMAYIGQYIIDNVSSDHLDNIDTVVLSGGDMFQGGIESNLTRGAIMVDAMNIIGFDAMVLGNHEFDWGEEYIAQFASTLDCPIISSNTFYASSYARPDYISPFTVIDRGDLRIGIIGGAEYNMGSSIVGSISKKFAFPDPVPYIKQSSTELRLSYNCDVVIAAFHDEGYDYKTETSPEKFYSLTEIDPETNYKYVDAMFFAHDHYTKNGKINTVPYMESGCNGRYVGIMTLELESENYKYNVTSSSGVNRNAFNYCRNENARIANLAKTYADVIGDTEEVIYTFKKSYSSDAFTKVVCEAMYWYVNSHMSLFDNKRVYLASHNLGGVRASVSAGKFTRRNLYKVFPFDNELCLQICTKTQIERTIDYDYYETYTDDTIVYDSRGYTNAVSITYITESRYARNYQDGYTKYPYLTRDALVEFLKNTTSTTL